MPRDTMPDQPASPMATAFERLLRLRDIAAKTQGNQGDYTTCLFHELRTDAMLAAMGLPDKYQVEPHWAHSPDTLGSTTSAEWEELAQFFGISRDEFVDLCTGELISFKQARLEAYIRDNRATKMSLRALEDAELEIILNR